MNRQTAENPLKKLDDWDDFVASRYKENKVREEFRNYDPDVNPGVAEFYRQNHALQTVDFVLAKEREYQPLQKEQKTIWEAAEFLNTLVDDSDPDTDLTQIDHLLQTSEAIRKDGHPRWFVLTGFIHDLGKVLCLYGEPQWAVVGDTFPVGCAYADSIVFPEYFRANPDSQNPLYRELYGIYEPHLWVRKCSHVLGARRIHLPGDKKLLAGTGTVHDAVSLVLLRASTWRLSPLNVSA